MTILPNLELEQETGKRLNPPIPAFQRRRPMPE